MLTTTAEGLFELGLARLRFNKISLRRYINPCIGTAYTVYMYAQVEGGPALAQGIPQC